MRDARGGRAVTSPWRTARPRSRDLRSIASPPGDVRARTRAGGTDVGEPFWIYLAERSVVGAVRLPKVVGRDVALQALRRCLDRRGAAPARLAELARELGGAARLNTGLAALLS